jgi:lysophospholipase L1-like esterase
VTRVRWQGPLLAVVTTAVALVLAEFALGLFAPVANPYDEIDRLRPEVNQYIRFEYPPNYAAVTTAEPGLPGLAGHNRFTTNNKGFRGDALLSPKPDHEFRIFTVGGSTTECFYVDDADDMSRVLQNELSLKVPPPTTVRAYNVGYSGAASDDHVAMISQRLVYLEPDLIVVFSGINDLTRSIYDYDYQHYVGFRTLPWRRCLKHVVMQLQLVRRVYYLKQRLHSDPRRFLEERVLSTRYAGLIGRQRELPVTDDPPRTDEASYATNLRSMVGLARAHGFDLVFMTQQTTWNSTVDPDARSWSWMRTRLDVTYPEDRMDAGIERLNDTMRAVAAENDIPVFDLARTMPKSLEFFYDDCHFNRAGSIRAGHELADFILAHRSLPTPDAGDSGSGRN